MSGLWRSCVSVAVLVGCAADAYTAVPSDLAAPESARGAAVVELRLVPPDLATGTGTTVPFVSIADPLELDADTRRDWERRIHLTRVATGEPIVANVEYFAIPAERHVPSQRFFLRPTAPLESGWYELSVDAQSGYELASEGRRVGDRYVSRFRVDSHPIVQRLQVEQSGHDQTRITLTVSERVVTVGDVHARFDGRDIACALSPRSRDESESLALVGRDERAMEVLATSLELLIICDGVPPAVGEITLDERTATLEGVSLHGADDTAPARFMWIASGLRSEEFDLRPDVSVGRL